MAQTLRSTSPKYRSIYAANQIAAELAYEKFGLVDFRVVAKIALDFANHIEEQFSKISQILLEYESYEVVQDECNRTLDLLRNLHENKEYFQLRVGEITSFLPRNQPLYALACFVLVPSLMGSQVHFRVPNCMRHFFPRLLKTLNCSFFFPNVIVSKKERLGFLMERSAIRMNSKTQESIPVCDAVIFTGIPAHAERLRLVFDKRTLFITNGAGHNPIVVSSDANAAKAAEAALVLQLYNQGQDCAAPNTILVHKKIFGEFLKIVREKLRDVHVGQYGDKKCRVGPISDPEDLVRIQHLLIANRHWCDPYMPGIIRSREAIVEPTIICRPLKCGGNYTEVFAPIMFIQEYEHDEDLSLYFEDDRYARNAMYISLYGSSDYVHALIGRKIGNKILHDSKSVLRNTHLHALGVERGTQPYGGYGFAASSISFNGKIVCKPTLPQRDIFDYLVKPALGKKVLKQRDDAYWDKVQARNVHKLLGLKVDREENTQVLWGECYVDTHTLNQTSARYVRLEKKNTFSLLKQPNKKYIASLMESDLKPVRKLRAMLIQNERIDAAKFAQWLYQLPCLSKAASVTKRKNQQRFFRHIYNLLLGTEAGPRLVPFLLEADRGRIAELLDV
ncbi:MAG: hypothetical protein G01um101425_960 [Candidatus Peregrinibacteria bacterium Gr01-1014_25]|nr:MAG: hypothetical protein G01um101425_960 [Candidatus Peregrinibacteria bacterium Gr01-1014_25]